MEGSGMWISPSKSAASPTRENNENDPRHFKITPKTMNPKEEATKHHFMSPTISASSKAAPPRNKILSERNQNAFEPYSRNLDPTESPMNSSVKAYNPLTNYLSPRPKYLRYNPNRRMEISSRLDMEEFTNDSFDSQEAVNGEEIGESCFSPKPENEENNVEDDEEEEFEEENGWNFKGVLKFLLMLIACVLLSTSYICTRNSPIPTPGQQAILKVKDGYYTIKRQTLEVFGVKGQEGRLLDEADYDEFEGGIFFEEDNGKNEEGTEGGIIEGGDELDEEIEKSLNVEAVQNDEVRNQKQIVGNSDKFDIEIVASETEDSGVKTDEVVEVEGAGYVEQFEVKGEDVDQSVDAKTDDIVVNAENIEAADSAMKFVPESYEQLEMEINEGAGSADQIEVKSGDFVQTMDAKLDEVVVNAEKIDASDSGIEPEPESDEQSDIEIKGSGQFHELELPEESESHGVESNDNLGKNTEAIIGVSLISVIFASLGFIYRLKKSPSSSKLAEKSEAVVPKTQKLEAEDKRKIEFFARPSLLQQSIDEAPPQYLNHRSIYAPNVELMAEIVVGQPSRRVTRNHRAETELPQPISTTSSLTYGGFTTETKNLKKEGVQSVEFTAEGTPVRRSSRLRSRAAIGMSP